MSVAPNLCCDETKNRGTYTRVTSVPPAGVTDTGALQRVPSGLAEEQPLQSPQLCLCRPPVGRLEETRNERLLRSLQP